LREDMQNAFDEQQSATLKKCSRLHRFLYVLN